MDITTGMDLRHTALGNRRARQGSRAARLSLAAILIASVTAQGHAATSWQTHETDAVAVLPDPEEGSAFSSGSMSCAEQKWSLALRPAADAEDAAMAGPAVLTVDRNAYPSEAEKEEDGSYSLALGKDVIEPLKRGNRLAIAFGDAEPVARFSLRGSRRAITAVAERCTPRTLPTANRILLTAYSSYLPLARSLREADIKAFTASTSSKPSLAAAMLDLDGGKRLLFTELCGSSWYYGVTGCNITAFAPDATDEAGWRAVLDIEGAAVYADPATGTLGWPDISTLPVKTEGDGQTWQWNGNAYALRQDERMADGGEESD